MIITPAIDVVRKRPLMYTGVERPRGIDLADRLVYEILLLHSHHEPGVPIELKVKTNKQHWGVMTDYDWMHGLDDQAALANFGKIVPFPEDGPNSMRFEILVAAFAADFLLVRRGRQLRFSEQSTYCSPYQVLDTECAVLFELC